MAGDTFDAKHQTPTSHNFDRRAPLNDTGNTFFTAPQVKMSYCPVLQHPRTMTFFIVGVEGLDTLTFLVLVGI